MNANEIMQLIAIEEANKESNNILYKWKQYRLKRANTNAPYHYRRNGKLYLVLKDKANNIIHKLQNIEYNTLQNTCCKLSNKMSKNARPAQSVELDAAHLAYIKYNK